MRSLKLSLVFSLLSSLTSASSDLPLHCANGNATKTCQEPLGAVTTVAPGSFYVAKLPCLDCAINSQLGDAGYVKSENDLFFNVSRTRNHNYLLLNGKQIFPSLATSPRPPMIYTNQIATNYSQANLDDTIACAQETCRDFVPCLCIEPNLGWVILNFDYAAKQVSWNAETRMEKWEITFDPLGDPNIAFNRSDQLILKVALEGRKRQMYKDQPGKSSPSDSSLFEPAKPVLEWKYDLEISSVGLVKRSYTFPDRRISTFWDKVRHFFGKDVVEKDGHVVYLHNEWGNYGKKGSLKNGFGKIIHDWPWELVAICIGSVLAAALVLYAVYRLSLVAMQQRELARWDGMDTVWERLRQERTDEDEVDGLLEGGYRDYSDDDTLTGYTDEVTVNKPLPAKPLPDKPLPPLPLIDA